MKKLLFCLSFLFFSLSLTAQEINWMSMEEALEAQKEEPKKIFMDAYTTWCGPCKLLDKNTFSNEDVIEYVTEHYYAVKFNAEGDEKVIFMGQTFDNPGFDPNKKGRNSQHSFASALRIRGYPTLLFFDEKGAIITPVVGYRTPQQLELYLKMFAKDDHLEFSSKQEWKAYEKNFEPVFKN